MQMKDPKVCQWQGLVDFKIERHVTSFKSATRWPENQWVINYYMENIPVEPSNKPEKFWTTIKF